MKPTKPQKQALAVVRKAIANDERLLMLLYGGVRAGKSTAAVQGMVEHSRTRSGKLYGLGAYTLRQCIDIFEEKFIGVCEELGLDYAVTKGGINPHFEIGDNRFILMGGNDVGRDRNIQGLTLDGLILDELPLLNRDFVMQAEARTSANGALRIYTANKPNPYHWTTKHYYKRAMDGTINATLFDWDTRDNPHISKDYVDERINEYDDLFRDRFINNEFVLDAMPLYEPDFDATDDKSESVTVLYGNGPGYDMVQACATDYGLCVHTAISIGIDELIDHIPDFERVFVNSDRPMIARQIRQARKVVRAYDGMYQPRRVEFTQHAIAQGKLRLHPLVQPMIESVSMYSSPGVYTNGYVRGLELMGEYLCRT